MKLIFLIFGFCTVFCVTTTTIDWEQNQNRYFDSFSGENSNNIINPTHIQLESVFEATSTITVFIPTFKWTIKNLNLFDFQSQESLNGPRLFAIDHSNDGKIYDVQFSLNSDISNAQNEDYDEFSQYKIVCQFNIPPVKSEYEFIINDTLYTGRYIEKLLLNNSIDNLVIIVKPFYYITKESKKSGLAASIDYENNPTSLRSDLLNLFKMDSDSQFIIECGGEEITAYKPIMQARSDLFKDFLSNGTNRLKIHEFSPKIVKKVVEFCNNEFIENFEAEEKNIFSMAHAYKIPSLMAYLSKEIINNVNNEKALALYKFAEFYNYEPLKKWLLNYVIKNLIEISAFQSLDPNLYKPILQELLKQQKFI